MRFTAFCGTILFRKWLFWLSLWLCFQWVTKKMADFETDFSFAFNHSYNLCLKNFVVCVCVKRMCVNYYYFLFFCCFVCCFYCSLLLDEDTCGNYDTSWSSTSWICSFCSPSPVDTITTLSFIEIYMWICYIDA